MSPKNKGKFGKAKPQIEEEDEFVSGVARLSEKLKPYAWRIAVVAVIVAIGLVSVTTYRWWQHRKEIKATTLYVEALDIGQRPVSADDAQPPDSAPLDEPSFPSLAARNQAEADSLARVGSEYGGVGVGQQSRIVEGSLQLQLGQYDKAMAAFQRYLKDGGPEILKAIAREGIGYALEAKALAQDSPEAREKGLREALAAFEKIQPKPDGPFRDYSLYHQARILATLDQRKEAIDLYNQILDLEPPSTLDDKVNQRLALLKAVPE